MNRREYIGFISGIYILCGRDDEWTEYQMEISSDEYYELEGEEQVTVLCLPKNRADFKVFVIFADRHHVSD